MKTHGMKHTRIYRIWCGIITRISNSKHHSFNEYGKLGITVIPKWLKFENFYKDMGPTYKDNLTIERKNSKLGYSKSNCRWATMTEQNRNKSNNIKYKGETAAEASIRLSGFQSYVVYSRLRRGWDRKKAFLTLIK